MTHKMLVGTTCTLLCAGTLLAQSHRTPVDPSTIVARVGDTEVSSGELESLAISRLARLRADEYAIKRQILNERVESLLLATEAAKRQISVEHLLKEEVTARAKAPTTEEVRVAYEARRAMGDRSGVIETEQEAQALIASGMMRQRVSDRRKAYIDSLRATNRIEILLEPPRVDLRLTAGASAGPKDALVTIVEFSDFQCPYCRRLAGTLGVLRQRFGDRLRVEYKHYPLATHKNAQFAAEAAVCADEQGQFWQFHDRLFSSQTTSISPQTVQEYVNELGLNAATFDACLTSGRATERVLRDRREGDQLGVTNTPTFFVNGRYFLGALPLEAIADVVEEELERRSREPSLAGMTLWRAFSTWSSLPPGDSRGTSEAPK